MPLTANYLTEAPNVNVELDGFLYFRKRLYAMVTTTAANNWTLYDELGALSTIAGSAADPTYITMVAFRIETTLTGGTNGDMIKVGVSATDTGGYIVNSAAVGSNVLAANPTGNGYRLAVAPTAPVALTADLTLNLYLHNGSNLAPGGTLAAPAATPRVIIPVEVYYMKRAIAPFASQFNIRVADARTIAGITG